MRASTAVAKARFGALPIRGIEVGVQFGIHAQELLKNLNFSELVLADIWEPYVSCGVEYDFSKAFEGVLHLFSDAKNVSIHRGTCDAVGGEFDFAYIDGDHSLPAVLHDLRTLYPRMRPGGLLAGHDYSAAGIEVIAAVLTFSAEHGLRPRVGHLKDDDSIDWWIEL